MKILVSILLLVFGVTTCFAQSSTPDYIQKAKVGLNQYYPQFKDYFEPIFAEYNNMGANVHKTFNSKIHDNFDTYKEELTSDRDKCATILTVMDDIFGDKTYIKSKKTVDSSDGEDLINSIASEIIFDIDVKVKRDLREAKERHEKAKIEHAKAKTELAKTEERNKKLKEIINILNNSTNSRESIEKIVVSIEDYYKLFEVSEIKEESGLQGIIKQYIDLNKQINRRPSALGQKFIDEYNRITKNK